MKAAAEDVTVLRSDPSLSASGSFSGNGTATPPRVLKQRFVLDEKLGSGGMGTVFRAKDLRKVEARDHHPYVAVKVLNNDFREHPEAFIALQREAAKSQGLSHRNIVSIYDFDKDGDVPFIIMELLEGQELAELLRAYPTGLPDDMVWKVVRCMCAGLEHAHEAGLVHADFKPGNVFVAPDRSAKILDFGIARAVQINQAQGEETVFDPTRLAALTPAYASAEMLDGAEAEVRDDLFSLGVVIYLMLTGVHPYGRTPANEAAREGLKPLRVRRLSRRQWRVLERCLAFKREQRPASVGEVITHLFQPSPWRSRTALVAAMAVLATVAVSGFKEDAAVEEAKVEARQTTLLDSQLARLAALAAAPMFDEAWETKVAEEMAILRALPHNGDAAAPVIRQILQRYHQQVVAVADPDAAVTLYRRGREYGPLPEAEAHLTFMLEAEVLGLLDAPALSTDWMQALDGALARYADTFPGSSRLEMLRLEAVDVLSAQLETSLTAERFPAALTALAYLERYSFAPEDLEAQRSRVERAQGDYRSRQAAAARADAQRRFRTELDSALGDGCLRFDPSAAAAVLERWVGRFPAFEQPGRQRIGEYVGRCVTQLAALDQDRAGALQHQSVTLFGPLPGVPAVRQDPCAASYLVGSGGQGGRSGFCADTLDGAGQGPRLVVVPDNLGGAGFAITRQEVSWAELAPFCQATGRCDVGAQQDLPAAGIDVAVADAYAAWLSEHTGFTYRLPTYAEWLQAAEGTSDPNRNCQVQLGGVSRGLAPVAAGTGAPNPYGLVNVLGNVQEWVRDGTEVKAAGGAFRDAIADCRVNMVRAQGGAPDPATGFRLVREVS